MTCVKLNCPDFMAHYQAVSPADRVLLDVRTHDEVADGMLPNAVHIPLDELEVRGSELDKSKEIYLYCRSGMRSQTAMDILQYKGFEKIVCSIEGGYEQLKSI